VVDVTHPLPKIDKEYNILTHLSGGGFITEGTGARAVKQDEQGRVLKEELHTDYRRWADYFHISDGAVMYRDILNDEWLTDAVVLPESMVSTAMEAFHDSGYGAHMGHRRRSTR